MISSLQSLTILLSHYGYFFLFIIAIFEGPIITVIAAFLASIGIFNVFIVYGIAVVGDFLGDGIWYWVGRSSSKHFFKLMFKYGTRLGITEEKVTNAEIHLKKHFFKTMVTGKITNIVMLPIIIACGILKINYKKFIFSTLALDIPKDLFFTLLGFYFGGYYMSINNGINRFFVASTVLLIVCLATFVIIRYVRKMYQKYNPDEIF